MFEVVFCYQKALVSQLSSRIERLSLWKPSIKSPLIKSLWIQGFPLSIYTVGQWFDIIECPIQFLNYGFHIDDEKVV